MITSTRYTLRKRPPKRAIQYASGKPSSTHAIVETSAYLIERRKIGRKLGFSAVW